LKWGVVESDVFSKWVLEFLRGQLAVRNKSAKGDGARILRAMIERASKVDEATVEGLKMQ
jgi:hypothetical protein